MKKIILIVSILLVLVVGGVFAYSYFMNVETPIPTETIVMTEKDGRIYTNRRWVWKAQESKEPITYVDSSSIQTSKVSLHLRDNIYYDINIPVSAEYINDFSKTLWAIDGSFIIRVIGDVEISELAATAGVTQYTQVESANLICSTDNKSAVLAKWVDGSAIIVNVYANSSYYSVFKDSLSDVYSIGYKGSYTSYEATATRLRDLEYNGNFSPKLECTSFELAANQYLYENGYLWEQTQMIPYSQCKPIILCRLEKLSGRKIDSYYEDDKIFYATSGEYCLGLYNYNTNTVLSLIGFGEEAECNIKNALSMLVEVK